MTSAVAAMDPAQRQRPKPRSTATHEAKKIISKKILKIRNACTRVPSTSLFPSSSAIAWPNPLASIGSNIDTGTKNMNGLKAWFTKGPAQDTYKTKILPEMLHLLENCGLPEGDLFLRDYMIGPSEDRAIPTVMICCIDKNIRTEAQRHVSREGIVKRHGFKLGNSALCLEAKTMPIRLMEEPHPDEESDESHDSETVSTILGGRVFFQSHENGNLRAATAGPVVLIGEAVYQLTVAHILNQEDQPFLDPFLDQEETDLDEFELESDHDEYGLEHDCGIASKGNIPSGDNSDENDLDEKGKSSELPENESSRDGPPEEQFLDSSPKELHPPAKLLWPSDVSGFPKPNHNLDYLLFNISHEDKSLSSSVRIMNTVHPNMYKNSNKSGISQPLLEIRQAAAIGSSERDVMLITAGGIVLGRLVPGTTSYRQSGKTTFQKVHIVLTESQFSRGDCGAAVIDASTGCFYGHIVLGVPGTSLAYIVPSLEVLQDIKNQTGLEASLDVSQFQGNAEHGPPRKKIKSFGDEFHSHLAETPLSSQEQQGGSTRQMVCPFYRLDPFRYQKCCLMNLRRFSDVKQHIKRVHSYNAYYCPICQASWSEKSRWIEHLQNGYSCQPAPRDPDSIRTLDLKLLDKIPRGIDDAQKYAIMWNSLFQGPCPNPWREDLLKEFGNQIQLTREESLRQFVIPDLLKKHGVSLGHSQTHDFIEDCILEFFNEKNMRYPTPVYRETLDSSLPSTSLLKGSDFSSNACTAGEEDFLAVLADADTTAGE